MMLAVGMALGLTLIQIIGAYLRYLPFEAQLPRETRRRLWKYVLLWAPVACAAYVAYFGHAGLAVGMYKLVSMFGWIPFFLFSVVVIPHELLRHVFVFGMQTLWLLLLHTAGAALILMLLPPALGTGVNRLAIQTALYILFFLMLLPLERRLFRNLLPPCLFVGHRLADWCFALLPLGLCALPLLTLVEKQMIYTWPDMLERFVLLIGGFFVYRYALYIGERAMELRSERHTNELLSRELQALESHAALLNARAEDVRRVRHDLRHYNRLLASLLRAGEAEKALALVEAQDRELLATPLAAYCQSPLVNAALTTYLQLAKQDGIRVSCHVDIDDPNDSRVGDNDLAILLSNVIENAVIASRKQPEDRREMRVSLAYVAMQHALVVENRFDPPLRLGDDGLPTTAARGHGAGMVSLRRFREKYGADVIYEQKDGWVRLLMYWGGEEQGSEA